MWRDPELASIETDYSLPSISPPICRPFSEMPDKYRFRTFFGFDALESVRLLGTPRYGTYERTPASRAQLDPPSRSMPSKGTLLDQMAPLPSSASPHLHHGKLTPRRRNASIDHRGLPIQRLRASHRVTVYPSYQPPSVPESETTVDAAIDLPPQKKVRFDTGSFDQFEKPGLTNNIKGVLAEIVESQIGLARISAAVTEVSSSRSSTSSIKRKADHSEYDEGADRDAYNDMDMEIDD